MLRFVGGVGEDVMWDQGNGSSHDHENGRSPNWGITLTATPNQSFKSGSIYDHQNRSSDKSNYIDCDVIPEFKQIFK